MKSLIKLVAFSSLLVCAGLCFSQSKTKTPAAPKPKASSPAPAAAPTEQAKPEEEEAIPPEDPNALFPAVVARINGKPILGRDLEKMVRRQLIPIGNPEWKNLREEYQGQLTQSALETLINSKLVYQKALASGIRATDAEVQAEMQKLAKTFQSDAEMNAALAKELTDRATVEKDLYQSIAVSKYLDEHVNKKIAVTPDEVTKYYTGHPTEFQHPDIVRTSHILIPAGDTEEQDALAKKRAEALLARAKKGEDFAKLAKENSTDPTASQGGDIGFLSKEAMSPDYADEVFGLPVGGLKMVKSQAGYDIIRVTDKKKEGLSTLEEVKDGLTQFLKDQKTQAELTKLINQLRDQAKIEILIPTGQPLKP